MLKHYLITALRHFTRQKVITGINVFCLALGLACFLLAWGTATSWAHMDRYHSRSDRTQIMTYVNSTAKMTLTYTPWQLAEFLKVDFPQLELVARLAAGQQVPLSVDGNSSFVSVAYADPEFLRIFDLPFVFGDSRVALDRPRSAVVSAALAKRLFGTDEVIGRTLRLSGREETVTITGVLAAIPQPSHFDTENESGTVHFEALLSMDTHVGMLNATEPNVAKKVFNRWDANFYFTYLVLPQDASLSIQTLNASLDAFAVRHVSADLQGTRKYRAQPVGKFTEISFNSLVGSDRTGISSTAVLQIMGVLVLLVACVNYANLATTQAAARSKEVALRKVVGATRLQLMIQYLIEATLLTSASLVLAFIFISAIALVTQATLIGGLAAMLIALPWLWVSLAAVIVTVSIAAGAYPALSMARVRPVQGLRNARSKAGPRLVATVLVGVQFCSASFLLIAMLVMLTQNEALKRAMWNPQSDPIVIITNDSKVKLDARVLQSELLRKQGVQAVSGIQRMPWSLGGSGDRLAPAAEVSAKQIVAQQNIVGFDFFKTLNIALLAGRDFDREHADDIANIAAWLRNDVASTADFNVVIDHSLAQRMGFTSPELAVGKTIYRPTSQTGAMPPQRLRIVGVVENAILRPMSSEPASFYLLNPEAAAIPIVRISKTAVPDVLAGIDQVWRALAPDVPLRRHFANEQIEQALKWITVISHTVAILAALAAIIAVMSLIGTALHIIRLRTHEIGVRKTLGASVQQILVMMLRAFSKPVLVANLLAWPLAYLMMRGYLSMFANSAGLTWTPFIASLVLTLLIAWAAVIAQSLGAARLRPSTVLKYE